MVFLDKSVRRLVQHPLQALGELLSFLLGQRPDLALTVDGDFLARNFNGRKFLVCVGHCSRFLLWRFGRLGRLSRDNGDGRDGEHSYRRDDQYWRTWEAFGGLTRISFLLFHFTPYLMVS